MSVTNQVKVEYIAKTREWTLIGAGPTPRAAIDAAIKQGEKQ